MARPWHARLVAAALRLRRRLLAASAWSYCTALCNLSEKQVISMVVGFFVLIHVAVFAIYRYETAPPATAAAHDPDSGLAKLQVPLEVGLVRRRDGQLWPLVSSDGPLAQKLGNGSEALAREDLVAALRADGPALRACALVLGGQRSAPAWVDLLLLDDAALQAQPHLGAGTRTLLLRSLPPADPLAPPPPPLPPRQRLALWLAPLAHALEQGEAHPDADVAPHALQAALADAARANASVHLLPAPAFAAAAAHWRLPGHIREPVSPLVYWAALGCFACEQLDVYGVDRAVLAPFIDHYGLNINIMST